MKPMAIPAKQHRIIYGVARPWRSGQGGARGRGFTFIELVITLAILSVLALVALPFAELTAKRAKEQELRTSLRQIRTAIDDYKKAVDDGRVPRKVDESGYPPSLDILVEGVSDPKDPSGKQRMYFLRRLPRDPMADDATLPASRTWGLRSYESSHDTPRPGKDVFDVYSTSDGVGLSGVPYRQW
jgi:general secretion pathway protein G